MSKKIFYLLFILCAFIFIGSNNNVNAAADITPDSDYSDYVDSDYMKNSLYTIEDYAKDLYKLKLWQPATPDNLYRKNLECNSKLISESGKVGSKHYIFNRVNGDNLITDIIPKYFFTSVQNNTVVTGKEYGFYIDTQYYAPSSKYDLYYGTVDGDSFEIHGDAYCWYSNVFVFDIEYDTTENRVAINPLFMARYYTLPAYTYYGKGAVCNVTGSPAVMPDVWLNEDEIYDKGYITNVLFHGGCNNAINYDGLSDNMGTYLSGYELKIPEINQKEAPSAVNDVLKQVELYSGYFSDGLGIISVAATCLGYGQVGKGFDIASDVANYVGKGASIIRFFTKNEYWETDYLTSNVFLATQQEVLYNESTGKVVKEMDFVVGKNEYKKGKYEFKNSSFNPCANLHSTKDKKMQENKVSAKFLYAGLEERNNKSGSNNTLCYLYPTNYELGFSLDIVIDDTHKATARGHYCYSNVENSNGEYFANTTLPAKEHMLFVIQAKSTGEYTINVNSSAKFTICRIDSTDSKPLLTSDTTIKNSVAYASFGKGSFRVEKGGYYSILFYPYVQKIYDISQGYYAGKYKYVDASTSIRFEIETKPIIDSNQVSNKGYSTNVVLSEESSMVEFSGHNYMLYEFVPLRSMSYTFETSGSTDSYMILCDSDMNQITYNDDGGSGLNSLITYSLEKGKKYFVGVRAYADRLNCSTLLSVKESEIKNSQAINIDGTNLRIFAFNPTISSQYVFETLGSIDTYMILYDSNMNQITYNDDGGSGLNSKISYQLNSGNKYYIAVRGYGNSTSGSTTLTYTKQ